MERDEIVRYWIESSDDDYRVMQSLLDNGHYVWVLFLSHLVTTFNLRARYPDYKNRFQKKANRQFAESQISKVKEVVLGN